MGWHHLGPRARLSTGFMLTVNFWPKATEIDRDHGRAAAQPVQRATWMLITGPRGDCSRYCG